MDMTREEEKQALIAVVNCNLNMWSDSGEADYLDKAVAAIRSRIMKDREKEIHDTLLALNAALEGAV